MTNLIQRLLGGALAVGLASCLSDTGVDSSRPEAKLYPVVVEVPASIDYTTVLWDQAYVTAVTTGARDGEGIYLVDLRFESYLPGKDGMRVIRVFSKEEVNALGIETRPDLTAYLNGKAQKIAGYIGPNLLL